MRVLHLAVAAVVAAAAACDGSGPSGPPYDPQIPGDLGPDVTNQFFPLVPGSRYEYAGETSGGTETITIEVLDQTRIVNGVTARVVRDRVYLEGDLIEDTFDWYAQDGAGNVWYLGEDSKEIENGQVVSTAGSWEWGVGGALPGIYMWADPAAHAGESYRQEFAEGIAEDYGKVVGDGREVSVPQGSFTGCLETEDWNSLDPGTSERKFYCPGIGLSLEVSAGGERIELGSVAGGSASGRRSQQVEFAHTTRTPPLSPTN